MTQRQINRLIDIAQGISIDRQMNKRTRHYAFILNKNKIISIGTNSLKTHPKVIKYNYHKNAGIHAELAAIIKSGTLFHKNNKMITFRFDKSGGLNIGKPCCSCQELISSLGFKEVWYSQASGDFKKI